MDTKPIQNALTVLIPIKPELADMMREGLKKGPFDGGILDAVGTVHFARIFVFGKDNPSKIAPNIAAIITSYDGDFAHYIKDFVNHEGVAGFFDNFLLAVADPEAKKCSPVKKNALRFAALLQKYDATNPANTWGVWYSAYPGETVQNILHPPPSAPAATRKSTKSK
jgi:hypothetical protein